LNLFLFILYSFIMTSYKPITITTFNVQGLNNLDKASALQSWILSTAKPDALALQETFLDETRADSFLRPLRKTYFAVVAPAQKGQGSHPKWGTILLVRRKLVPKNPSIYAVHYPYQVAAISLKNVTLVTVYLPPSSHVAVANHIRSLRNRNWPSPTVFMGDWNTVLRSADTNRHFNPSRPSVAKLSGLIKDLNLFDPLLGRSADHINIHWTWSRGHCSTTQENPDPIRERIDMILISSSVECIKSWTGFAPIPSDHRPVSTQVKLYFVRGPGHWRLSNWVLESDRFSRIVDDAIRYAGSLGDEERWPAIKWYIFDNAKFLGRILKNERLLLAHSLEVLEREGEMDSLTYRRLEAEYRHTLEVQRLQNRDNFFWLRRDFQRPSKRFSSLVAQPSQPAPPMEGLQNDEGLTLHNIEERL
jgi:exonuclease III